MTSVCHSVRMDFMENNTESQESIKITSGSGMDLSVIKKGRSKALRNWILVILVVLLFFTPFRINTLIIGIDRPPEGTWIGRSDTMIITTLPPILPQISILSIPRDLWVAVPGHYDNRINTAHYFAELNQADSGKRAAAEVVKTNFGINVNYVVRVNFDGVVKIVDAMGGVTVDLPVDMSGMSAGNNHLDGTQALRFVRDRANSDDFFRQQRGQLFIVSAIKEMLNPVKWVRIPAILVAVAQSVDSNIPVWAWPRFGYGILFSAIKGFNAHTLEREMVTPWVTDEGAQVLLPNWELINPLVDVLFH
jgi:polyisoprenyl-teichoic acid--peptidoglycan teichoic acid transferase